MAALFSLLIHKHGQNKGGRHLNKCRAYPSCSKRCNKASGKIERGRSCSQVKKLSSYYFTVAVKSSGDISAEPVKGQKIEEHVVTGLDLSSDENRPSLTSGAVAEERPDVSSQNTIDEVAGAITGGNDIRLWALWPAIVPDKTLECWLKYKACSC